MGSSSTAASASTPARAAARVPLPVHSSSMTEAKLSRPRSQPGTAACNAPTASAASAKPPFMSPAPRPASQPSRRTGWNGGADHSAASAGTTSMCPLRSSDGPVPAARWPTTLPRPA